MKNIILATLFLFALAQAKTITVEVCSPIGCDTRTYSDVRKSETVTDMLGNQYLRITFDDGKILDVRNAKVKKSR